MSINPIRFVQAFHNTCKAHNLQSLHVSMLADTMGVNVIDLVQFLLDNPGIATAYELDGTGKLPQGFYIGDVGEAILTHAIPNLEYVKTEQNAHQLIITLVGGEFVDESEAEDDDNYIVDLGSTGVSITACTAKVVEKEPITTVVFSLDKAPTDGEIVVVIRPTALVNGKFSEAGVLVVETPAKPSE